MGGGGVAWHGWWWSRGGADGRQINAGCGDGAVELGWGV
jgi:hypothetical protein